MRTRIVAAFPGTGKSTYHRENPHTTLDSDSSEFSWCVNAKNEKVRSSYWPQNYISHIKENIGKYEIIFISTHAEVRKALVENCIFFYLVYPSLHQYEDYVNRYKARGNDDTFIELVSKSWMNWILELQDFKIGCKHVQMNSSYLTDILDNLIASEKL